MRGTGNQWHKNTKTLNYKQMVHERLLSSYLSPGWRGEGAWDFQELPSHHAPEVRDLTTARGSAAHLKHGAPYDVGTCPLSYRRQALSSPVTLTKPGLVCREHSGTLHALKWSPGSWAEGGYRLVNGPPKRGLRGLCLGRGGADSEAPGRWMD